MNERPSPLSRAEIFVDNKTPRSDVLPYLALVGVQFFFGTGPVVGKIVLKQIPAVGLVGFRIGLTALVLVAIQAARKRFWLPEKSDYWRLAVLSLFGVTLNQIFFVLGLFEVALGLLEGHGEDEGLTGGAAEPCGALEGGGAR